MNLINHLKSEKNLTVITDHINAIIKSEAFVNYVQTNISDRHLLQRLETFTILVIPDRGTSTTDTRDLNQSVLEYTKFRSVINNYEDLLEQFTHESLHNIAWMFWKKCPVNYNDLTAHERDVFEEMWGQAYLNSVSPKVANLHKDYLNKYIETLGEDPSSVDNIIRLFGEPENEIDKLTGLDRVHTWLYSNAVILTQEFFSRFMLICQATMSKDSLSKQNIINYNKIFNGGQYEPI